MNVPGVDHPEQGTLTELALPGHGLTIRARVETVDGNVLLVRPTNDELAAEVGARPGDAVEILWRSAEEQRVLPAEVTGVEDDDGARWRLRSTGPAEARQRRGAVRARVAVQVSATIGEAVVEGEVVDLSEAGLRARFAEPGDPPEAGTPLELTIGLEDGWLTVRGEIVRSHEQGAGWLLSIRFTDIEERVQDRLRRRVFQALREERARLAGGASGPSRR